MELSQVLEKTFSSGFVVIQFFYFLKILDSKDQQYALTLLQQAMTGNFVSLIFIWVVWFHWDLKSRIRLIVEIVYRNCEFIIWWLTIEDSRRSTIAKVISVFLQNDSGSV